ncbi:MAG: 30S ribosomal protein S9 [Anaerolineae bacterium]|nr:30S ribosomal protein S9 [Anaerolineae bacterium]
MEGRQYFEGIGRRKRATARVRIYPGGSGQMLVNGKDYQEFFGRDIDRYCLVAPFEATQTAGQFDMTIVIDGGGITGQSEAARMGAARALLKYNADFSPMLRKAGLLTRDAREKERKKPGLRRARKATQYTKR